MATVTLKSTGGDYSLMSQWEAFLPGTLTEPETLECYKGTTTGGGWNADGTLTDAVTIQGFTTTDTNRITVKPGTGQGHGGVVGEGFTLTSSGGGGVVVLRNSFLFLEGISITNTSGNAINITNFSPVIDSVIATSAFGTAIFCSGGAGFKIINCLVDGFNYGINSTRFSHEIKNNTSVGTSDTAGISCLNKGDGVVSNVSVNAAVAFAFGSGSPSNNASDDLTGQITGVSVADGVDFTSPSTDDYTPASGGKLDGAGTSPAQITLDITGATRNDPDDVGAYALASGPTPVTINPDALTQNQTLANVTLTHTAPSWSISADSLSQDQTVGNVTVNFTPELVSLAVNGLSQDQTLDSVTLTYVGVTIGFDSLSQSQTISPVDIDFYPPTGTISPSGLAQSQTLGNVTLTYTPETVVIEDLDLSQSQGLNSVILAYTPPLGIIAPEAIYQQQIISNITLTYTPPLVSLQIDDAEQMQFITSVRFGGLAEGTMSGKVRTELAMKGLTIVYH